MHKPAAKREQGRKPPIVEIKGENGDEVTPPPPEVIEPDPALSPEEADSSVVIEKTATARQAQAEMDAARSRLERARQLFDKGLLPKADFDTTNSAYKVAEAK